MFSVESPHRGDSNEYTHNIPLSISKRKSPTVILNTIMSAAMGFCFVRDSIMSSK